MSKAHIPSEVVTLSEKWQNCQRFHNPKPSSFWENFDEKCPYVLYKSDRRKKKLKKEVKMWISTLIFIYTIHFAHQKAYTKFHNLKSSSCSENSDKNVHRCNIGVTEGKFEKEGKMRFSSFIFIHTIHLAYLKVSVIHLQFWAYGFWDSLLPTSMSPTANLWVQNTIFNAKSAILLHHGTRWNKNFASKKQNYAPRCRMRR